MWVSFCGDSGALAEGSVPADQFSEDEGWLQRTTQSLIQSRIRPMKHVSRHFFSVVDGMWNATSSVYISYTVVHIVWQR